MGCDALPVETDLQPKIRIRAAHRRSIGLVEGIHPRVVQEMLGHTNITLTLATHSHVLPTMQRGAADKLDEAFSRESLRSSYGG